MQDSQQKVLAGQVALVTGAATGIGRATAFALADAGAALVLGDIDAEGVMQVAAQIREGGGMAVSMRSNVTSAEDVAALVALADDEFGRLDCAVNNAAVAAPPALLAEIEDTTWDLVWGVNVDGLRRCMQHEIRYMLAHVPGVIVNLGSNLAIVGTTGAAAYVASKHAVIGLTKAAALDYATTGIRINAVCPGPVLTQMALRFLASDAEAIDLTRRTLPIQRFLEPEEIAAGIVWLCSPASSGVFGHGLMIDGAWTVI